MPSRIRLTGATLPTIAACGLTAVATAQVTNLRITEVDSVGRVAEVTNTGPAFNTAATHPFCHRFTYTSNVPNATAFAVGQIRTFNIANLNQTDTDIWLYTAAPFSTPANLIHGVKFGPQTNIGRMSTAVTAGRWTTTTDVAPAAPAGHTLAWDGFGFSPRDWYVDATPTLGSADSTTPGTVPSLLADPSGTDTFEGVSLGDEVIAMQGYIFINDSAPGVFTVRAVGDVRGVTAPRPGSTSNRWMRIRDQEPAAVQNRFYTTDLGNPPGSDYQWTWWINLEETPPAPGNQLPRLTIQHFDNNLAAFANAWGIEFGSAGVNLVVTGIGGAGASAPLYTLVGPTAVGQWVKIELIARFSDNTVAASINDGAEVSLPIGLAGTADENVFRFCYRGEGAGNVNTMLLDDVTYQTLNVVPPPCPGDINGDRQVNLTDLAGLLANFGVQSGATLAMGDLDGDGDVDLSDLAQMLAVFGSSCPL
ncbi:MAG: dockerin type I domain-containing protein [Phycisphaerae bacterium]